MAEQPARGLVLGDLPTAEWASLGGGEPWVSFRHAAELIESGNLAVARQQLYSIVSLPHLQTRHYLQAWKGLRELGEAPKPNVARLLYAVVLDMPVENGWDTLAVYRDYSCQYLHQSGKVAQWGHPDDSLDQPIDALFAVARPLAAEALACPDAGRFPLPGQARISLLCPGGALGQTGPVELLSAQPGTAAVLQAGTRLLQALVELTVG